MHLHRLGLLVLAAALASVPAGLLAAPVSGLVTGLVTGTLYFTTFAGDDNVHQVPFSFDGTALTLGAAAVVAATPGADGIIVLPDGSLLIGGQGDAVYRVDPATGAFTGVTAGGASSYLLALEPGSGVVWTSGIPGVPAAIPLSPFADGTVHSVSGDDRTITGFAFTPGKKVFYTSSGPAGFGHFGTLDLGTSTTKRISSLPAAHGIVYDPFSDTLLLFGAGHVTQLSTSGALISDLSGFSFITQFNHGTPDGEGHVFVASNSGDLLFIDYSASGKVGDPSNFVSYGFLADFLDDVAPLVIHPAAPVPEPASLFLLSIGALAAGAARRRRRSGP